MQSTKLKEHFVKMELLRLVPYFPEAGHNGDTINYLAREWTPLLIEEDVTVDGFIEAIKEAKKRCRFFPKLAEILTFAIDCRGRYGSGGKSNLVAISDVSSGTATKEEIERNSARINVIKKMLGKSLSIDQAIKKQEEMVVIKEFGKGGGI